MYEPCNPFRWAPLLPPAPSADPHADELGGDDSGVLAFWCELRR
jgi:hypothetical protein